MKKGTVFLLLLYALLVMYLSIIMWFSPFDVSATIHLLFIIGLILIALSNFVIRRIALALFCSSIAFAITISLLKNLYF
ncbi:MAG: hypothetical protein ACI35P_02960 [Bacillus sp. (in: firmicutes)]